MNQKEATEQVQKLVLDNPAKFIKIRDIFDDVFEDRALGSANAINDYEFKKIRGRFQDIDVPFSWCIDKESIYQLHKAVRYHRTPSRGNRDDGPVKKSAKGKKKGIFGIFG